MAKQFTIIDGYNVLHECGFVTNNVVDGELEKARERLLGVIGKFVSKEDCSRTTVVFDSERLNLPNRFERHGILVEFASEYEDADQLIEKLIAKHSAAKQLTIVSSDHRLHKAARTRGATPIDSGDWLDQIQHPRNDFSPVESNSIEDLGDETLSDVDVDFWMNEMGADADEIERSIAETPRVDPRFKKTKPKRSRNTSDASKANEPNDSQSEADTENGSSSKDDLPSNNPFPPGYADDLFE